VLQCFNCHCELAKHAGTHRVVYTGYSAGGRGFSNQYRKVLLCPKCAAMHDHWQRMRRLIWPLVGAAVLIIVLIIVLRQYWWSS
jgi:hypothetical protein